jgi:hypothetical protein
VTPNIQFHRSVNSRLRRLSPPGELGRYAALKATWHPYGDCQRSAQPIERQTGSYQAEFQAEASIPTEAKKVFVNPYVWCQFMRPIMASEKTRLG